MLLFTGLAVQGWVFLQNPRKSLNPQIWVRLFRFDRKKSQPKARRSSSLNGNAQDAMLLQLLVRIADGMEEMKGNYNSLLNESVTQKISIEKLHSANINLQNQLNASFKERSKLSALVPPDLPANV